MKHTSLAMPVVLCALLAGVTTVACRDSSKVGTAASEANAETGTVVDVGEFFTFSIAGSGEVPPGARCASGFEEYEVNIKAGVVARLTCEGKTPAIVRAAIALEGEKLEAVKAALATVTTAPKKRCANDRPFVSLTGALAGNAVRFTDPSVACDDDTGPYADNLGNILQAMQSLGSWSTQVPFADESLPGNGDSVWTEGMDAFSFEDHGSGTMPIGSSCIPGASKYAWTEGGQLEVTACTAGASGKLRSVSRKVELDEATVEGIRATIEAATRTEDTDCAEAGGGVRELVLRGPKGEKDVFIDEAYACLAGADSAPAKGFQAVVDALAEATPEPTPTATASDAGTDAADSGRPGDKPGTATESDAGTRKPRPDLVSSESTDEGKEEPGTTAPAKSNPKLATMKATAGCASTGGPAGSTPLGAVAFAALGLLLATRRRR